MIQDRGVAEALSDGKFRCAWLLNKRQFRSLTGSMLLILYRCAVTQDFLDCLLPE